MVVWLGSSSGGCSFTAHCAAGLSLDAEVVPLAAREMSCLLPFPYTPRPNEQHGAGPAFTPFLTTHIPCYLREAPSILTPSLFQPAVYLILVNQFSHRFSLYSSLKPFIFPSLLSRRLSSQSQRFPSCGLTA